MNIKTLVDLVVARAMVDKTEPDKDNLRNGWRTDALLTGDVDAFVVGSLNKPGDYAKVARGVLIKVKHLPEISALAQLAIFRGERLLPIDSKREQFLIQMVAKLQSVVFELSEGTRKMRCQSLLDYHAGVFCNACGRFDLAAKMQAQSAEAAIRLGDNPGAAIALLLSELYQLKEALRTGTENAPMRFYAIDNAFTRVTEALRSSPLFVQWAEANCPMHMIQASAWLDLDSPRGFSEWVGLCLSAAEKLGKAFKPGADLILALNMHYRGARGAFKSLTAIVDGDYDNEIKATALLVLARRAMLAGKDPESFVKRIPEQGAQHVCAIARRMLAEK